MLLQKECFEFGYNSDCRGKDIFLPVVGGRTLKQVQVPVSLPTYDELIGRDGVSDKNYNESLLSHLAPGKPNVLTIHAEVEGIGRSQLFDQFLAMATLQKIRFVPLGAIVAQASGVDRARIVSGLIPGREGSVAVVSPLLSLHPTIRAGDSNQ